MTAARIAALALILLLAGCTAVEPTPREAPPTGAAPGGAVAVAPAVAPAVPPAVPPAPSPSEATQAVAPGTAPAAAEPATPLAAPPTGPSVAKAEPPSAKAPAKAPAPPAKKESPAAVAGKPEAPPPLDLASLETRLKQTTAIGVMTKLALKNQVDDLLDQFRAFYQGRAKTTLAELRKSFDLLVLKVLSLVQDGDPSLASSIVASREAIWGILSDPVKFANFAKL